MMMMGDKKKLMTTVIGKLNGETAPAEEVQSDASIGKESAIKKLFSALSSKDYKSGAAALEDFLELHEPEGNDEEPDPEYAE